MSGSPTLPKPVNPMYDNIFYHILKVIRMALQSKPQLPKQPALLTLQEMNSGIERLKKRLEDVNRFEPRSVIDQFNAPALDALGASIDDALVRTLGADTLDYERYKSAKDFERGPYNYKRPTSPAEFQRSIARSKDSTVALLGQAIKSLEEQLEEHSANPPVTQTSPETPRLSTRKVFIVHGHEGEPREAVSNFLRKIDFTPVILHEQSNQGRTIVEKFEAHAEVDFAVVLLTPDDVGGPKGGTQQPRAPKRHSRAWLFHRQTGPKECVCDQARRP
jgi:hypothetical protein